MRGCCLITVQYQRVSVHLSHELKSPRGCLAQIKFQRVIIHLHPQKEERKKQSNYIEVPPRVSQITRRRHADGRGGGRRQMLAPQIAAAAVNLPKTVQRRVERPGWGLGGGGGRDDRGKKRRGNFHFHRSSFDEKCLRRSPWGSNCGGGQKNEPPPMISRHFPTAAFL